MSWDGMYPVHGCKDCGELLGKVPAELYAGTHTGLCYPCTNKPAYIVEEHVLDGAKIWSHPPMNPAHRPNRNTYTGYDNCLTCDGKGKVVESTHQPHYHSWGKQCPACFERYHSHITRVAIGSKQTELRELVQDLWDQAVREHVGFKGRGVLTRKKIQDLGYSPDQVYIDLAHTRGNLLQAYDFGSKLLLAVMAAANAAHLNALGAVAGVEQ